MTRWPESSMRSTDPGYFSAGSAHGRVKPATDNRDDRERSLDVLGQQLGEVDDSRTQPAAPDTLR